MRHSIKKTVVAALAALGMAVAAGSLPTPAEAQWHGGGSFHGGGFGGGWRGGGWGGGWGRPGWGGGWGWRRAGWGGGWGGCWNCGWGWGGGWGWGWDPGWAIAAATVPVGVRHRFTACLWRRSRLLGPAAGLDSQRTLSWPKAREHLHVSSYAPVDFRRFRAGGVEIRKAGAAIMNVCSAFTANTCL